MELKTAAERMYENHLKNVSKYQKKNPEKMRVKYKNRMENLKKNPEEYALYRKKAYERCKAFREKKKNTI